MCDNAKEFLVSIAEKFKKLDKAETGNFLTSLTTMKYDVAGSVHEHIVKMVEVAPKLTDLDMP